MNLDKIDNNFFLKKMFPNGILEFIMLGRFSIDISGYCDIDLHIKQMPEISLSKYGLWGKDFNVIVLKLKGRIYGDVIINNWLHNDFVKLDVQEFDNFFTLRAEKDDFKFYIEINGLIFQEISTYKLD